MRTYKQVGFTNTSHIQGDKLILNNGLTSSISFGFSGSTSLTFSLPQDYGSSGYGLVTDGLGNLSFGVVSSTGGITGGTGATGPQGVQGVTGSIGLTGSQGPQGFQGTQGNQGDIGSQGVQGSIGQQGVQGVQGVTGSQGPQGFQGTTGTFTASMTFQMRNGTFSGLSMSGSTSLTYSVTFLQPITTNYVVSIDNDTPRDWSVTTKTSNGFILDSNSTDTISSTIYWSATELISGTFGAVGAQGVQGPQGFQGSGVQGAQGSIGPQGFQGNQGSVGSQGVQGSIGAQGFQGTQGNQGPQGFQGTQGTVGNKTPIFLTDAATISWSYTSGFNAGITISATRSMTTISGMTNGDYATLVVHKGVTSSKIIFGSDFRFPSSTYSFSATSSDIYGFLMYNNKFIGQYNLNIQI